MIENTEQIGQNGLSARLMRAANSRFAPAWLFLISFLNSFIVPFPAEAILIPLCLAHPRRWAVYASISVAAAALGALVGYGIGAIALETIGMPIIHFYSIEETFQTAREQFRATGVFWIMLASTTPFPYLVVSITCGAAAFSLILFISACLVGRSIQYFATAGLVARFGTAALKPFRSRTFQLLALVLIVAAIWYVFF